MMRYMLWLGNQGHVCNRLHDLDELQELVPGNSPWAKMKRWFRRRLLISSHNLRSIKYMRSTSAINYERRRQIQNYNWMIHPFSEFRLIYEITIIIMYIGALFYQPVNTVYLLSTERTGFTNGDKVMLLCDLISMLGIAVNLRTGYLEVQTNIVHLAPKKAARHYLRSYFVVDFFAAVPLHIIPNLIGRYEESFTSTVDIILMLRIIRVMPVLKFYKHTSEALGMGFFMYHTTRIVFLGCVAVHYIAACLFLLERIRKEINCSIIENTPWIIGLCRTEKNSLNYLRSLFWSLSITFKHSCGYDNPSIHENLVSTMIFAFGSRILLYCAICRLVCLVTSQHSSKSRYYAKILQLEKYMKHKRFPPLVRNRIQSYYDYRLYKSHFAEELIFNTINPRLREEIVLHCCQKLVENVTFFNNIPMSLIIRIVMHLHREIYLPNDVIIRAGEVGSSMYFIKFGTVAIYKPNGREVCHLEDGAHFGEVALVMPKEQRVATVIAIEMCEVYRLDKGDFHQAISPFPDLLARIIHVANDRVERTNRLNSLLARARNHPSYIHKFHFKQ